MIQSFIDGLMNYQFLQYALVTSMLRTCFWSHRFFYYFTRDVFDGRRYLTQFFQVAISYVWF